MTDSPKFIGSPWGRLSWSEWIPLDAPLSEYQRVISHRGGLYITVRIEDKTRDVDLNISRPVMPSKMRGIALNPMILHRVTW